MMSGKNQPVTEGSVCRNCGGRILWVTWPRSGKAMPVDATPNPSGDIVLTLRRVENKLLAEKLRGTERPEPGRNRYRSHFDSCTAKNG